jgi:hypothetical protein
VTWHDGDVDLLRAEIAREVNPLAGFAWEDMENALWLANERTRVEQRAKNHDYYSRAPERRARNRSTREWRQNARGRVVAVRCCPFCRKLYAVTAYDVTVRREDACSGRHRNLLRRHARGNLRLLEVDGERDTVDGLAKKHGLAPSTLHKRLAIGMGLKTAVAAPITPPGQRRWGELAGTGLGPLARAIVAAVEQDSASAGAIVVRVQEAHAAFSTGSIQTTITKLAKLGLLLREGSARAYVYRAAESVPERERAA